MTADEAMKWYDENGGNCAFLSLHARAAMDALVREHAELISRNMAQAVQMVELLQRCEVAVHESNRRDKKWKDGIERECGCKIEFDPLRTDRAIKAGPPTLGEFVRELLQYKEAWEAVMGDTRPAVAL
jgi:hypothetical protein